MNDSKVATVSTRKMFADDVQLSFLDDAGIVFSQGAQKLYALNTSATFIWSCIEEGRAPSEIAPALQRTFEISQEQAEGYVSACLAEWRGLDLLADATGRRRSVSRPRDDGDDDDAGFDVPAYVEPVVTSERRYRLLTSCFRLRFTAPLQEEWVHPVLAHLEVAETGDADTVIDIVAKGDEHLVYRDRAPLSRCTGIDWLAPVIKSTVWQVAVNNYQYFLDIHAGVVGDGERCFLFPGAPGSGKSSLTAALVRAGFQYFSDEVALLEDSTLHVLPMPLGLCVKSTGWDVLASIYPELADLRSHHRGDGKIVRYLPPPDDSRPPAPDQGCPVGWIVFPKFAPDAATSLEPLDKVAALHRLMEECLVIPKNLDTRKVTDIVEWIKSVDCYEMPMSSLTEAVALIRGLSRQPAT